MSNNQVPDGVFFTSEYQDSLMRSSGTINYDIQQSFDPLSLWHSPPFSSISLEEAYHEIGGYSNMLTDLSSFEAPSSLQPQQVNTSEIPCLEEIVLHGLEKGQSSGTKRKQASDSLQMQTEETDEDGPKEDSQQPKRKHSAEEHNQNNRLRRQKFKEKLKTLQELIPNCTKRDKESTLDEAINYIKLLQCQLQEQQMMYSKGVAGNNFPMSSSHSPWAMPVPGMQFPHNFGRGGTGMGYGMGIGMGLMGKAYSMANLGFPTPTHHLLEGSGSSSSSGLTLPLPYSNMPGNILFEPWPGTTSILSSPGSGSSRGDEYYELVTQCSP